MPPSGGPPRLCWLSHSACGCWGHSSATSCLQEVQSPPGSARHSLTLVGPGACVAGPSSLCPWPGYPLTWDGTTAASGPQFSCDVGSRAPGRGQSGCWAFSGLPGPAFPLCAGPDSSPVPRLRALSMLVARVPLPPPCPGAPVSPRHRSPRLSTYWGPERQGQACGAGLSLASKPWLLALSEVPSFSGGQQAPEDSG